MPRPAPTRRGGFVSSLSAPGRLSHALDQESEYQEGDERVTRNRAETAARGDSPPALLRFRIDPGRTSCHPAFQTVHHQTVLPPGVPDCQTFRRLNCAQADRQKRLVSRRLAIRIV